MHIILSIASVHGFKFGAIKNKPKYSNNHVLKTLQSFYTLVIQSENGGLFSCHSKGIREDGKNKVSHRYKE